ncbi:MAG: DUF1598 domain-containing protein [Planctomycetaceae bacterium]|jgi:hypothetical protein|nr:DUF1598 domain-containing protein [Planctomycetaceae bacterium]
MKYDSVLLAVFIVCFGIAGTFAQDFEGLPFAGNGIDVDSEGRVLPLSKEQSEALGKMVENDLDPLPEGLDRKVSLRKVSLKKIDATVKDIVEQHQVLPDAIRYLGGLTSIDYIVAVPDENDLLLIGPAEGWQSNPAGNIVGKQSGLPVLVLEDLLTALREWQKPVPPESFACSIEPAPESLAKLARLHKQFTMITASNADAYGDTLEEAYGDCPITITGVPASSRFAKVLVGADFKMKRIALGLESSQVRGIPSYVSLVSAGLPNISPQFLLVPAYESITHDSKKLTWRLGDVKVRASSRTTGKTDRAALTWCRNLEENYDALAKAQPVFGELRNNMKLALAAALIRQENLLQKANCSLTILLNEANLKLVEQPVPKMVTYCSVQSQNGYSTVVACGGVEINPSSAWRNNNLQLDHKIDSERKRLKETTGDEWWSP